MRSVVARLTVVVVSVILVACGDLPTGDGSVAQTGPPLFDGECWMNANGSYTCDVQDPAPPECDPYHYDCGGDDCIYSYEPTSPDEATVQGCSGGGGDGGDGGGGYTPPGGGSTPPPPGSDPTDPTDPTDPIAPCPKDPMGNCITTPVDSTAFKRIQAAIARMKVGTEWCAGAKGILDGMTGQGVSGERFRVWTGTWYMPGIGPVFAVPDMTGGQPHIWLSDRYIDHTLVIAHEAIHLWLNWLSTADPARWQQMMAPYEQGGAKYRDDMGPGDAWIYDGDKDQQCT
jgi:hypothetical protein